jgi:hypothetical protein
MNLTDIFKADVQEAVTEKLASFEMDKEAAKKHKNKRRRFGVNDAHDFAIRAGGSATGALIASVIGDIRSAPVDFAKGRLYAMADSAASHFFRHK